VSCLLENIGEFSDCCINIRLCFEFPLTIYLFAYLRFISVPVGMRLWSLGFGFTVVKVVLMVVMIGVWSDGRS